MLYLRDFWFPVLLFLSAAALGLAAMYAHKTWRRTMLGLAIILAAFAALAFVYGDPVRGPFAYLAHPHNEGKINFWAGVRTEISTKQLSDGFDFSHFISFGKGTQPFELWIQRTWPFRWKVKLKLAVGKTVLVQWDDEIQYVNPNYDMNYDDRAVEIVYGGRPAFQLIASDDYDFYVNAVMDDGPAMMMIINGNQIKVDETKNMTDADFPQRIFKYPAYSRLGERN